jgi:anti-sigma factor ChrR (cupin superfamily)
MDRFHLLSLLDDEEFFLAAADGEMNNKHLPERAKQHLAQCALCRQQLALYQKIHLKLLSALYRSQCPTSARLSAYCAYTLPGEERSAIQAHLYVCPLCKVEVEETQHFFAAIEEVV